MYDVIRQAVDKKDEVTNVCNKFHNIIPDCCEQAEKTEDDKVTKLLNILRRRDNRLLEAFYEALDETDQTHITEILRQNVVEQQQRQQQGEHTLLWSSFACIILLIGFINMSSFSSSVAVSQKNWELKEYLGILLFPY